MLLSKTRVGNFVLKRQVHGNAEIVENCKELINRNPRNLERLRVARKPRGYSLEKGGFSYWHKLVLTPSQRYITAEIQHFENGVVLSASTQEWGLKKQLYSTKDTAAYKNVGRVLAQRCLESGICEIYINKQCINAEKEKALVEEMEKSGICLYEPKRYLHPNSWDKVRKEKPWETCE